MNLRYRLSPLSSQCAFTFAEVVIAVGLVAITFVSLYAALSSGFAVVQLSRENLRGTQIIQEKMETIRLYNWDQITTPGFLPTNFVDTFYPGTQSASGITYTGKVTVAPLALSETYSNDLLSVTVNVQWVSAKVLRQRGMTTFVSRYGLQ